MPQFAAAAAAVEVPGPQHYLIWCLIICKETSLTRERCPGPIRRNSSVQRHSVNLGTLGLRERECKNLNLNGNWGLHPREKAQQQLAAFSESSRKCRADGPACFGEERSVVHLCSGVNTRGVQGETSPCIQGSASQARNHAALLVSTWARKDALRLGKGHRPALCSHKIKHILLQRPGAGRN